MATTIAGLLLAAVSTTALLLLHLPPTLSSSSDTLFAPTKLSSTDYIRSRCSATLYPATCYASLSGYAFSVGRSPGGLARAAVSVALRRARRASARVAALLRRSGGGPGESPLASALRDCRDTLADSSDLMRRSLGELRRARPGEAEFGMEMGDVETWMSAALTDEETCTDGIGEVEGAAAEGSPEAEVVAEVVGVKEVTSNALALVNSYAAKYQGNR